jgi:hypothetical protein
MMLDNNSDFPFLKKKRKNPNKPYQRARIPLFEKQNTQNKL